MKALRILIAEDNAIIGMLLSVMLGDLGYEVCGVETTEAGAVAAAARHRPDLMIVDAWLGEGSGVAAIRTILLAGPMPHLFMSGAIIETDMPGTVILRKPFHEHQLVQAVAQAIGAATPLKAV